MNPQTNAKFKIVFAPSPGTSGQPVKKGRGRPPIQRNIDLEQAINSISDNTVKNSPKEVLKQNMVAQSSQDKNDKIVFMPKYVQKKVTVIRDQPKLGMKSLNKSGIEYSPSTSYTPSLKKKRLGDLAMQSWASPKKNVVAEPDAESPTLLCRICGSLIKDSIITLVDDSGNLTETGTKLKTIVGSDINDSPLYPPACCKPCSFKVNVCFSLLIELQASDEVVRCTYADLQEGDLVNPSAHIYSCHDCEQEVIGMKGFIAHYEGHMQTKTIGDTQKNLVKTELHEDDDVLARAQRYLELETDDGSVVFQNEAGDLVCEICGRSFKYKFLLQLHKKAPKRKANRDPSPPSKVCFVCKQSRVSTQSSNLKEGCTCESVGESHKDDEIDPEADKRNYDKTSKRENDQNHALPSPKKKKRKKSPHKELEDTENPHDVSNDIHESNGPQHIENKELRLPECKEDKASQEYKESHSPKSKENRESRGSKFMKDVKKSHGLQENEFHNAEFKENNESPVPEDEEDKESQIANFKENNESHAPVSEEDTELHSPKCKENKESHAPELIDDNEAHVSDNENNESQDSHDEELPECDGTETDYIEESEIEEGEVVRDFKQGKTKPKTNLCKICGMGFKFESFLRKHHEKHAEIHAHDDLPVAVNRCHVCDKELSSVQKLVPHLKTAHNIDWEFTAHYSCTVCRKPFPTVFKIRMHLLLFHDIEWQASYKRDTIASFQCERCPLVLRSKNAARVHMKTVHNVTDAKSLKEVCELCNRSYTMRSNLEIHINSVHKNIRPLECEFCDSTFVKHSSLIMHRLRHTGEKPFQCQMCDKSFRQRNDVLRHLARHVRDQECSYDEAHAINTSSSKLVTRRTIYLKESTQKDVKTVALLKPPIVKKRITPEPLSNLQDGESTRDATEYEEYMVNEDGDLVPSVSSDTAVQGIPVVLEETKDEEYNEDSNGQYAMSPGGGMYQLHVDDEGQQYLVKVAEGEEGGSTIQFDSAGS